MTMHSPSRPGDMIGRIIVEAEFSVEKVARDIGVSPQELKQLIEDPQARLSSAMAHALPKALGSTAGAWLRMQENYDTAQKRKASSQQKDSLWGMLSSIFATLPRNMSGLLNIAMPNSPLQDSLSARSKLNRKRA